MCVFAALIFLGDSLEKTRWMATYDAPLRLVLKYSLLTMPSWLLQILPVACLLSALLVISDMISSGEWTACLAGGFTVRQIFKPIIICIAFVALAGFVFQELALPGMSQKARLTLQRKIKGDKDWYFNVQRDVTLRLDGSRVLFAKVVRADEGIMAGMFIDVYDDNWAISSQISARRFVWDKEKKIWFFEDGFIRRFGRNAAVKEEAFKILSSDYSVPPDEISLGKVDPDSLSIDALLKRIKFLNASGLTTFQERTFLHSKFSAPAATVIMCLLGMPLAIALKRSGKLINIVSAIAIGFTFWWIVSMFASAGQSGMINPAVAGWMPVLLFTIVACIEFKMLKI
jgi:lipopolysaccharide export system permease protein